MGPGPVQEHVRHASAMADLLGPFTGRFLDLGSGAGIPGLVLALAWPEARGTLLDSRPTRTAFLEEAIDKLALSDRLRTITARAEEAARMDQYRASYDLVVARSFSKPAVTAECARGFLQPGARLAISEPPATNPNDRWPRDGLIQLDLEGPEILRRADTTVAVLTAVGPPPDQWPRKPGQPSKRPLW